LNIGRAWGSRHNQSKISAAPPRCRFNLDRSNFNRRRQRERLKPSRGTDLTRYIAPGGATDIGARNGGTSSELAAGATLALSPRTSLYGDIAKLWTTGATCGRRMGGMPALG
jgi:hypothetical protein